MPLIPLQVPPGVYRNGTDLQSTGRWRDASLVRWTDNTMQPVGGWLTRVAMTNKPLRGAVAWRDLSGDRWYAAGSHLGLFVSLASNTVHDITPASFTGGTENADVNLAFGGGYFGTAAPGIPRPDTGLFGTISTWALDTWGEYLLACNSKDGRLLEWQLNTATAAAVISGAPTDCSGLVVTEERFVFALGAGGNYRKIQWCDREDNTTWTAATTNEAGDIELQTTGKIMLGIRARGQTLILTGQDAHAATYQGPPYVYGFERVGSSCGSISRLCAAAVDAGVFWMGRHGFYKFAGGAVQDIPCDVSDYVFNDINRSQNKKVAAVANARHSEIWWFYPSGGSLENDRYVVYNYEENHWAIGSLARTCGVDAGVFTTPIWMTPGGAAVNHELGHFMDGGVAYAESGPVQVGTGDNVVAATSFIPDEKTQGQATVTFKTRFHPNDVERSYGPYTMANPSDVRFTGRQVAMRVEANENTDWRWGAPRLDITSSGRR